MTQNEQNGRKAKTFRRVSAIICFLFSIMFWVTLGTAAAHRYHWISTIQIMPMALATSLIAITAWIALTLIFGRIYCSIFCPLGVMMDIFSFAPRCTSRLRRSNGYHYYRPRNILRYSWLVFVAITAILGLTILLSLCDPYTAFGRIITDLCRPLGMMLIGREVVWGALTGIIIAAVTLIVVAVVAAKFGRSLCNTFCPVGATLSLPARYSVYAMDINTDLCVGCNKCVEACKCHCIDPGSHTIDTSRCVVCFDCMAVCENGSISYTRNRHRLSTPMMIKTPTAN